MNKSSRSKVLLDIKHAVLSLAMMLSFTVAGQLSTIHYLPPLYGSADEIIGSHFLFVTNPTSQATTVRFRDGDGNFIVSGNGNPVQDSVVPGNTTKKVWLGNDRSANGVLRRDQLNEVITSGENIVITADDPVYVQVRHLDDIHGLMYSSKGDWAPGLRFRAGTAFSDNGRITIIFNLVGENRSDFISVMALNDNTQVEFREFKPGIDILDSGPADDFSVQLDQHNSYTFASVPGRNDNMFLTGTLIISNEPIVVNCGSWQIDNSDLFGVGQGDFGADQIIPMNRVDTEYILMNVDGSDDAEKVMVVADQDGTQFFINGSTNPEATLAAGEFAIIDRDRFSVNNNMYIRTNVPAVVYQTTGLEDFSPGFNVITPLKCWGTRRTVIPRIDQDFDLDLSRINVVAQRNTNINVAGGTLSTPVPVPGNPAYETYRITPEITDDIYITSNKNIQIGTSLRKEFMGVATYYSEYFQSDTMLMAELCDGEIYLVGNSIYSETGIYRDTLKNINECDSIITLDLLVHAQDTSRREEIICPTDSVLFEGDYFNEEGIYFATLNSVNGCDSTLSLSIVHFEAPSDEINTTLCEGEFYNGLQLFGDTSIVEVFSTVNGCDSTFTTNIEVYPTYEMILEDTICFGETIMVGNQTAAVSGQYINNLSTIDGCDSTFIVELIVLEEALETVEEDVCEGNLFLGNVINVDTSFVVISQNDAGCELSTTYTLTVNDVIEERVEFMSCPGDVVNGVNVLTDTSFVLALQSMQGCDSLVTNVISLQNFESLDTTFVNPGDLFAGVEIQQDTLFSTLLQSMDGCDSLANTQVILNPVLTEVIQVDVCEGELYEGELYTVDTTITSMFISSQGFDSIVTLNIDLQANFSFSIEEQICSGDSILFEGNYYSNDGTFEANLQTSFGCDSIRSLVLTVEDEIFEMVEVSICSGESYFAEGADQTAAGIYVDEFLSQNGCDSIVNTNLLVWDSFDFLDTTFVFEGEGYTQDTLLIENLLSQNGCDSIRQTQIILLPSSSSTVIERICEGETFEGEVINMDTLIIDTLLAANGADSFVFTQINLLPNDIELIDLELCEGEMYEGVTYTSDAVITESFSNVNDCDSTVTTNIIVHPTFFSESTIFLMEGEQYNGMDVTSDTLISDVFASANGCDSVVNVQLIVLMDVSNTVMVDVCEGEMYNGITILTDTVLIDTLVSAVGTDSILFTQIAALDTTWTFELVNACEGDVFEFNGILITEDNIITQQVMNADGCFDVQVNEWNFEEVFIEEIVEEICFGQSFTFAGQEISLAGMYSDTLLSAIGCDSIVNLDLSIFEMQNNELDIAEEYCSGTFLTLDVNDFGEYNSFLWEDGSMSSSINVFEGGVYAVTVSDLEGCQEVFEFAVGDPNEIAVELVVNSPGCVGTELGFVEIITPLGSDNAYEYSLDAMNFEQNTNFMDLSPGSYVLTVMDEIGCTIQEPFVIEEAFGLDVNIFGEELINLGDSTVLLVQTNAVDIESIQWDPPTDLSCLDCLNPTASPTDEVEYTVVITTADGCVDSSNFVLRVDRDVRYYIPTAFSPNGDGINDFFTIYGNPSVERIEELLIFDRWGNQVFLNESFSANEETSGWDGTMSCLLYTSPSPRDATLSRMPSSA